jgi:hypothetical protein
MKKLFQLLAIQVYDVSQNLLVPDQLIPQLLCKVPLVSLFTTSLILTQTPVASSEEVSQISFRCGEYNEAPATIIDDPMRGPLVLFQWDRDYFFIRRTISSRKM